MTLMKARILFLTIALFASSAVAQTLTGTVANGTTGKPAAGVNVTLLTLSQGMNESGTTKTDAQGNFSFAIQETAPHLVRATYQGVNYFPQGGPIPPNRTSTTITVYDAAPKLSDVAANVHVMRLQAPDEKTLQVLELIAVKNDSKPPRALAGERTWDIFLPEGAVLDQAAVSSPGGMPINSSPAQDARDKNHYYFDFPIKPGETRFQVSYHLPYNGEATFKPRVSGKLEHFALMMPKSMQFGARKEGVFSPMNDETGVSTMEVATNVTPDKDLSFRVTGTGMLPDEQGGQQQPGQAEGGGQMGGGGQVGPGGGLGRPEGTPDPLEKYRWAILVVCAGALVVGGIWVVTRQQNAAATPAAAAAAAAPVAATPTAPAPPANAPTVFLQTLKEELFQLELDRQQGLIAEEEYAKAKAALDQTLARAIARSKAT